MWFLKRCAILYSRICLESPPILPTKFGLKNLTMFYTYTLELSHEETIKMVRCFRIGSMQNSNAGKKNSNFEFYCYKNVYFCEQGHFLKEKKIDKWYFYGWSYQDRIHCICILASYFYYITVVEETQKVFYFI